MGKSNRRSASLVAWKSPEDQPMTLVSVADEQGVLQVEIDDGAVTTNVMQCQFNRVEMTKKGELREKAIAEVEITVPLARRRINGTFIEQ